MTAAAVYSIANVLHSLQALKEKIPPEKWVETPLPVIAAPGWWLDDVRREVGLEAGSEVVEIHECKVLRMDEIPEPCLIDHDGKTFPILPAWMRAKDAANNEGKE